MLMPRQTAILPVVRGAVSGTARGSPTCEPEGLYWGDLVTLELRHLDPHAEIKKNATPETLSKTEVFERREINRKVWVESGLNLSQNPFLISVSQKVSFRL